VAADLSRATWMAPALLGDWRGAFWSQALDRRELSSSARKHQDRENRQPKPIYLTASLNSRIAMSLEAPSYVVSLQNNIRSRPIPWEGAVRAKTITEADHKKIKAVDKVRKEQRKQVLDTETGSYIELFLGAKGGQSIFQSAAKRQDMVVYLLVLLDDSIEGQR
jgi:hypothetical protein